MKQTFSLEARQTQKLALTPEMKQAIKVLQMSAAELAGFLREEAEANPLLDLSSESEEPSVEDLGEKDEEWLNNLVDSPRYEVFSRAKTASPALYEPYLKEEATLREYLQSQLGLLKLSKQEYEIGELIIGNIDNNGYLSCSPEEIADYMGCPRECVGPVLRLVQSFEPPGVGARGLKECLSIQAEARALGDFVRVVIDRHLENLGKGRYKRIAKEEKVTLSSVLAARDAVLGLDPKPGARFSGREIMYIVPDVSVRVIGNDLVAFYNDGAVPRISWNAFYVGLLKTGDPEAKMYLRGQIRKARFLLNCIEQRRNTVLRVVDCIVSKQGGFFRRGPEYLMPLTLGDIASELGLHESTVSRAVAKKHVDTPHGIFPCKMLFGTKVSYAGENVCQHTVKSKIREILEREDPCAPLSDKEIAQKLSGLGLEVARRTVAKYRGSLGIPPASRRRRF